MGCFPFELTHRGIFSPGWCLQPGLKVPYHCAERSSRWAGTFRPGCRHQPGLKVSLVPGAKNARTRAHFDHGWKVCSLLVVAIIRVSAFMSLRAWLNEKHDDDNAELLVSFAPGSSPAHKAKPHTVTVNSLHKSYTNNAKKITLNYINTLVTLCRKL